MFNLPPSVRMLLFLIVGFVLGCLSGYKYAEVQAIAKQAENTLHVIIKDQKVTKKEELITNKKIIEVRKENEKHKPFTCSDAKLPANRVLRLQREIDNARRRSNGTLLDRAIEKASNL